MLYLKFGSGLQKGWELYADKAPLVRGARLLGRSTFVGRDCRLQSGVWWVTSHTWPIEGWWGVNVLRSDDPTGLGFIMVSAGNTRFDS